MKVKVVSNKTDLLGPLRDTGFFQSVDLATALVDTADSEIVLISDQVVDNNSLSSFYESRNHSSKQQVFYMLSNLDNVQSNDLITNICKSRHIGVIPPKMTVKQIIDRMTRILFPEIDQRSGKVVTFFGADSKVGTSMTAHACAEMLADNTNLRVGYFILNDKPFALYTRIKEHENISLDDIKIELWNNVLSPEKLLQTCIQRDNLYILQGPRHIPDLRHFHPEDMERLINLALQVLDIIIIDAGSNINFGLTIGALQSTNYKFLVTTQQDTAKREYDRIEGQLFKSLQLQSNDFGIIVNKMIRGIPGGKETADLYNMTLAASIPHLEFTGWQAEFDKRTLLHYEQAEYNEQIQVLATLISTQLRVEYKPAQFKRKGLIGKLLGGRKG